MIAWSESFNLGIEEIDEQHKKLIELVNLVYYSINNKHSHFEILLIFNELKEYALYHLEYEEKLMKKLNYNNYLAHQDSHNTFENKIFAFQNDIENKKNHYILKKKFIKSLVYFIEHIVENDKKFAQYFGKDKE